MGVADRWTVQLINDEVAELNYAEFGIETDATMGVTVADRAAVVIAYTTLVCGEVSAGGTRISALKFRAAGETVSLSVPFPVAEYDTLQTANVANFPNLVEQASYGEEVGDPAAGLAPLGTSVVVTEYTSVGGPAGRGRHYIPFIGGTCITPGGYLSTAIRSTIELVYNALILGTVTSPAWVGTAGLVPVVEKSDGLSALDVTNVKAQPVFSNLKSRRR